MSKKRHIDLPNMLDDIRCILDDHEVEIKREKEIPYGYQIRIDTDVVITCYVTGKIVFGGDERFIDQTKKLLLRVQSKRY